MHPFSKASSASAPQEPDFVALERKLIDGVPNMGRYNIRFRDYEHLLTNVKMIAHHLAIERSHNHQTRPVATPGELPLTSKPCTQSDMESDWLIFWLRQMAIAPYYHRKLWEFAYIAQGLYLGGMLTEHARGLGFGCGDEPLPSLFAKFGVRVLATDMAAERMTASGWIDPKSGAGALARIRQNWICPAPERLALIEIDTVDMTAIPERLANQFDFCWSACALEHLGSLAAGMDFIENSLAVLRPGGIAVHTTEFNLDAVSETIDHWSTVLFQRRHMEALAERLTMAGHSIAPLEFDAGSEFLDGFIDIPPYGPTAALPHLRGPHLRLSVDGFPCTSFGLIIRKAE